jgi:hypothetical protein
MQHAFLLIKILGLINNPLAFLWALIVLLYWQTYFYIYRYIKQNLFREITVSFKHTQRYIDNVISINNYNFPYYIHLIYPNETSQNLTYLLHIWIFYSISVAVWQLHVRQTWLFLKLQPSTSLFCIVIYMYHFHILMVYIRESTFFVRELFKERYRWQKQWCCKLIMNLI